MALKHVMFVALCAALSGCGGAGDDSSGSSSSSSSSSGTSGTQAASLDACKSAPYPGSTADPQTYSFDAIAQFDQCAYRATGDTRYLSDGNNQCKVLIGFLRSTTSSFRPIFCNSDGSLKL